MSNLRAALLTVACVLALFPSGGSAQALRFGDPAAPALQPFFDGPHDDGLPTPDEHLGQAVGTRLAHPHEIVSLWERWAALSDRVVLEQAGRTHEGRPMLRVIVSSPANLARLDEVRAGLRRLTNPRGLSEADADALFDELPAVAWMGYSIHGDELSGADAGLAVGWHLVAGQGADVTGLLDRLVVVFDPCMNPDGRERIVTMVEQMTGYVPNFDHAAGQRGRWPWGRGNHYLFDMNRDWMTGSQPETRARWASARDLPPQLFVDAHEMGGLDTFLFYPQADPHNPFLPPTLDRWQHLFTGEAAAAFDRFGWSYYTREWADAWGPFYSDAWGSLSGAVGMLYEQARTSGFPLRNRSGQVLTYREAVHHQVVASMANLTTAADHRRELLADYTAFHRAALAQDTPGNDRMLAVVTGRNPERERAFVEALLAQHIEVRVLGDHLSVSDVEDRFGGVHDGLDLPPGTWLIPARQPHGAMVKSFLSFDVRLDDATLQAEREDLERDGTTRLYDVTAWSMPMLADLEAYWCAAVDGAGTRVESSAAPVGAVLSPSGAGEPVAYVVDGAGDGSVTFASRALQRGVHLVVADEAFETGGRLFARGSVVARASDNDDDLDERVRAAAVEAGVIAYATLSGRAPGDGADLGGGHFEPLVMPRVAMLTGPPVRPDTFGHLWHLLDTQVGMPVSFVDAGELGWTDMRRYNVLVLPPGAPVSSELADWVTAGGTLIAVADAAADVAATDGLGSVVRRRDVLDELDGYLVAARREAAAREVRVDPARVWGDGETQADAGDEAAEDEDDEDEEDDDVDPIVDPDPARQDAWLRRFAPAGAIVRGLVDTRSWATFGCDEELPVLITGSTALLSRSPARAPIRLAPGERLRLSGLLWPEAVERLAHSAWLTVEPLGSGQVILFAEVPTFRGQFPAGARLFANAVVYGPGLGARAPVGW